MEVIKHGNKFFASIEVMYGTGKVEPMLIKAKSKADAERKVADAEKSFAETIAYRAEVRAYRMEQAKAYLAERAKRKPEAWGQMTFGF